METKQILNVEVIRKNFPILKEGITYLDNAATSLTPEAVIESMNQYYRKYNSNIHRAIHKLGVQASIAYEEAHQKVSNFINADFEEVIFTKSTTESLNLLARVLIKNMNSSDEIVLTEMEHHSNIVPWQQLAKEKGIKIRYIRTKNDGRLDMDHAKEVIKENTKIVSVTLMSNVFGTINPAKELARISHSKNAFLIVDAAQAVPHLKIDVKELNCDFLTFSGHKMLGPTGIGVLYGKKELLNKLDPFLFGGDMISEVNFINSTWNELPWKFEAGTPNIAEAIGLGSAVDCLEKIGMDNIKEYSSYLLDYVLLKLRSMDEIEIYGPKNSIDRGPVISFNIKGVHPHDVSTILDREGVAIRAGHMCAMPLVKQVLDQNSVCRASFYIYNTKEDINRFIDAVKKTIKIFK